MTRLSPKTGRLVWEQMLPDGALSSPQLLVVMTLATYAGGPGTRVCVSEADLAKVTGRSIPTLRRHLNALLTSGWIERVHRGSSSTDVDEYRLTIPPGHRIPSHARRRAEQRLRRGEPSWPGNS